MFLQKSPHKDIIDVMDGIQSGFTDSFDNMPFRIAKPQVYLIASSFGGPAALMNGKDKRVKKIVAFSPVIDWRVDSEVEPMDKLESFTREGFGNGYRFDHKDFAKLSIGKFYNPATNTSLIQPSKTLIFHADDDLVVPIEPAIKFAKETGCELVRLKEGGHLSLSILENPKIWRKVAKHLQ